uniref:MRG domain-containing protein n=1 Tax=Parastrongyloides trichosuri TaxID=131310 RepID=A0A0N4Z020_PARTI
MSPKVKDVSTRLIKPTINIIPVMDLINYIQNWDDSWEHDGSIGVYDEGIAQYLLTDISSHLKFYGSLFLDKPSLKCRLVSENEAPQDILEEEHENHITFIYDNNHNQQTQEKVTEKIKIVLKKRGFRFTN